MVYLNVPVALLAKSYYLSIGVLVLYFLSIAGTLIS